MNVTVPHHQQGPALRGDCSNGQVLFFTVNLALEQERPPGLPAIAQQGP